MFFSPSPLFEKDIVPIFDKPEPGSPGFEISKRFTSHTPVKRCEQDAIVVSTNAKTINFINGFVIIMFLKVDK